MTQKKPNGPCPFGALRQHEWMTRADNGVVECNFCQAAANIGLFAATPDLLAACQEGLRFIEAWIYLHTTPGPHLPEAPSDARTPQQSAQLIKDAIAKAKGQAT